MTPEQARETLPKVRTKVEGKVYTGITAGRKEPFASVFVENHGPEKNWHLVGQWSWVAIARAVSEDRTLSA